MEREGGTTKRGEMEKRVGVVCENTVSFFDLSGGKGGETHTQETQGCSTHTHTDTTGFAERKGARTHSFSSHLIRSRPPVPGFHPRHVRQQDIHDLTRPGRGFGLHSLDVGRSLGRQAVGRLAGLGSGLDG